MTLHSNSIFISDFQEITFPSRQTASEEDLGIPWIVVARIWALIVSFFGIPGNLITASTIVHQIFLQQRRQRLHSISESGFHQMKVIKEDSVSRLSESSSAISLFPKKSSLSSTGSFSNGLLTSPDVRRTCDLETNSASREKSYLDIDIPSSRESSPGTLSRSKYEITLESSPKEEREFRLLIPSYDQNSSLTPKLNFPHQDSSSSTSVFKSREHQTHSSRDSSPVSHHLSRKNSLSPNHALLSRTTYGNIKDNNYFDANFNGNINDTNGGSIAVPQNRKETLPSIPNGEDSFSSPPSKITKHNSRSRIKSSNSIRSHQSLSINRYEVTLNSQMPPSSMRVESDTILILHIIICDLLYCAVSLPHTFYVYGFQSTNGSDPAFCKEAAFFRYVNAFAEWMTLGLLAIQRCINLTKPPNARFFKMRSTIYFLLGIWILSTILQIGNLINNNFRYNIITHKCDYIGQVISMLYFYSLDSFLPCSLMIVGCLSIIFQIVRNKRRLQKFGMSEEVVHLREREMWQSACLVLSLLLLFLMCVIPICIFNLLYTLGVLENSQIGVILYMVYWIQYGINFMVYASSKRKFRVAYKSFFTFVFMQFKRCCRHKVSAHDVEKIEI